MISEKTVELNITTELVNWLYVKTGIRPYILAPSQRQEGVLGFDATIGFPTNGRPFLLQYKRAEFRKRKREYLYHLNHNATQDQHLRLYILELMGCDVFYALPLFHLATDVVSNRQHLLPMTFCLKPSAMIPVTGMTGHHEVRYNLATNVITIHSDRGFEINERFDFNDILNLYSSQGNDQEKLLAFLNKFNSVFANESLFQFENYSLEPVSKKDNTIYNGMALIVN